MPGATNYNVLQGINGSIPTLVQSAGATTSASVPITQPNTSYVFIIQAMGPNGVEIGRSNQSVPITGGIGSGVPGVGTGVADPARSTAVPGPPAPAVSGVMVTVTARDFNNLPVASRSVTLQTQRPGDSVIPLTGGGLTDGSGTATFIVRGQSAGPATFIPIIDGRQLPPVTVQFQ
jgi:hypothetical protein